MKQELEESQSDSDEGFDRISHSTLQVKQGTESIYVDSLLYLARSRG